MSNWMFLLFIPFFSFSQSEWKETSIKDYLTYINAYEKTIPTDDNYYFSLEYKIFNDYADKSPVTSLEGFLLCKNGLNFNILRGETLTVKDTVLKVTINKSENQIIVQSADSMDIRYSKIHDYSKVAQYSNKILKKEEGQNVWFNIELNENSPIKAIDLVFTEQRMKKVTIYSKQPYTVNDKELIGNKAKFVIGFDNFKKGKKVDLTKFKEINDIIVIEKDKIVPNENYKDFEIIDLRNILN